MLTAGCEEIKGLLFIKVTVYLRLSIRKKVSQKQNIASMETSYQVPKVPVLGEIKPPTPVRLSIHFFMKGRMKTVVLGNLFKVFRLAITLARADFHWG